MAGPPRERHRAPELIAHRAPRDPREHRHLPVVLLLVAVLLAVTTGGLFAVAFLLGE